MYKKTILLVAALSAILSGVANAQSKWQVSTGIMQFSEDDAGYDVDLEALYASLGYRIEVSPSFYVIPELTLATGISDDRLFGIDVEIDHFASLGARAQYEFESGLYLYGMLAWGDLELDSSVGSGSTDEVGGGVGIGYDFNERFGSEFSYGIFDETDVFQLGLKFRF